MTITFATFTDAMEQTLARLHRLYSSGFMPIGLRPCEVWLAPVEGDFRYACDLNSDNAERIASLALMQNKYKDCTAFIVDLSTGKARAIK